MTENSRYYSYPAILDAPHESEDYTVTFPDVPDAIGHGHGIHRAIISGTKALEAALIKLNYRPTKSSIKQIEKENPNKLVVNIIADLKHVKQ